MVDEGLDVLGRRVLGWLGGAALLVGLGLFLALAISHGWIDPAGRVILAGAASLGAMAGGVWLFERHGRTEAAAIVVGVATAGQWGTLAVAVDLYRLLDPVAGVLLALGTSAAATVIAVRWAGRPIAGLGLLGGLLSPFALGVAGHTAAIAILGLAAASVVTVTIWQRWRWLSVGALIVCAPQWMLWLAHGPVSGRTLLVAGWFTLLGLLTAVAGSRRRAEPGLDAATAIAAVLTALFAAAAMVAVWATIGRGAAGGWLAAVALAYAVCGRAGVARLRAAEPLAAVMTALALTVADGALALVLSGVWLTAAWGASALAAALLVRRQRDERLAGFGLGLHVGLTVLRAAQASVGAGHGDAVSIVSVAILAGACLAAGTTVRAAEWRLVLNGVALVATVYLTAQALSGATLVAAWCGEAAVLGELHRRTRDPGAAVGALGFLGLALAHALVSEAPLDGLIIGVPDVLAATVALGAIAVVLVRAGLGRPPGLARLALLIGAAATGLYLGSIALISAFQPAAGTVSDTVLDLGVRQQGQVVLSGAWSLIGMSVLVLGLRADRRLLRSAGVGILLVAASKVFLYDLSTLTSIYRVLSLVAIGSLCLGGAFAYQRLSPAPLPDLRASSPVAR